MTQDSSSLPGAGAGNKERRRSPTPATTLPGQVSVEQVMTLLEVAPLGIVISDSQRSILAINRQVEVMFGYERQELIGENIEILLPEEIQQVHIQHQPTGRGTEDGGQKPVEAHLRLMGKGRDLFARRKNGEIFPVEVGLSPLETPQGLLGMASILDISVRKSMESALVEAEQHYSDQLTRLQEINIELSQSLSFEDLCRQVVEKGCLFLNVDRIGLWFLDPQDPTTLVGSFGVDEKGNLRDERQDSLPVQENPVFHFLAGSKGYLHKQENQFLYNDRNEVVGQGSSATAGLWDGESITGYLCMDNLISNRPISAEQEKLLVLYAQIIGHLSGRKRGEEERVGLLQAAQRRADQLMLLNQIGLETASSLELSNLLRCLYEQLKQIFQVDVFYVVLYDDQKKTLAFPVYAEGDAYEDHATDDCVQIPLELESGFTSQIILSGQTLYIPDTEQTNQPFTAKAMWGKTVRTYLGVPLKDRGQVTGVLSIQSYQPQAYSEDMVNLLETIAAQVAIVIQNARLFSQVQALAISDPLTGLFNRRHFFDLAQKEFERSIRYQKSFSILMMDVDHVKQVNDHYGHLAGDEVLKAIAELCRQNLREVDLLGRYGGDEFVALLPETPNGAALNASAEAKPPSAGGGDRQPATPDSTLTSSRPPAERLRKTVAGAFRTHPTVAKAAAYNVAERLRQVIEKTPIRTNAGLIRLTISIGVAQMTEDCSNLEEVLERSDQALYQAKQGGRNRVVAWQMNKIEER